MSMSDVSGGYPGLIQNGNSTASNSYITVKNIKVIASSNSTLLCDSNTNVGGWICQAYFGKVSTNCVVSYCSSNAPIIPNDSNISGGGGILGDYSSALVDNCGSSGNIGKINTSNEFARFK